MSQMRNENGGLSCRAGRVAVVDGSWHCLAAWLAALLASLLGWPRCSIIFVTMDKHVLVLGTSLQMKMHMEIFCIYSCSESFTYYWQIYFEWVMSLLFPLVVKKNKTMFGCFGERLRESWK